MSAPKAVFVAGSDGAYGYGGERTLRVDDMRLNEFPHMQGSVYLDHAGATMYSKTQLDAAFQELQSGLFANPHSSIGDVQVESTNVKIDSVRRQVLAFFSASEEEYSLIFTSGATAALKLVGESFPWTKESVFAYSMDSHTSVLGIRGYAAAKGSSINCTSSMSLFAFPAECNFSGVRHSLDLYVATHRLNLSTYHPDFVVLSFYKIFGYPTGLGALIVRKDVLSLLKREYQGGNTVQSILAGRNYTVPRRLDGSGDVSARFADGTQSFLSILALRHGIEQIERLGMASISGHTAALRALLVGKLIGLKHWNGRPVCEIYGKTNSEQQGPIVACNYLRADGSYVGYSEVYKLTEIHNIHLRTGCFCNPGACQHYLGLKESDLVSNIAAGHVCGDGIDVVNGLPTGAVRLSLGYMTTFEDIEAFMAFTSKYFVCRTAPTEVTPSVHLCKLTLFPIKSCSGMVVNAWPVGSRGLLFDREFAIVDVFTGNALTLKTLPELCFLHPIIDLGRETLTISYRKPDGLESERTITMPSTSESPPSLSFTIAMHANISTAKHQDEDSLSRLRVCTDNCQGRDVGTDVSRWLSLCLGRQCALVRAQYLLISRQSIAHFNAVLGSVDSSMSINEDAFRANLIVDGCTESFEEDKWMHLRIGSTDFDVSGPCRRCSVINLDPHTGAFRRQPLQVLSSFRRQLSSIFFGQFLTGTPPAAGETVWLRIGDQVEKNCIG
ncbi:molybdenum cofactor sulfurase, putative [Phytophthora infestans T30-4]|uniref:Molybdenum cofactor sulfurase n=1 Tax=Phytophthora infestans (strain T30-4) TaxID=403677 RepID=D0N1F5_PHYIT|nr:molybdenum cofactor sulfurase, putative [Phytophthora infestans T30-4]EEY68134.1 molybdenum cofactor sulfurase, putative [Phytophthora infestans T30-4]|eukprot:XP_002905293.1 molybdenum cofactor sulfurase, putative [Phytophthora infestans T30-4]